VSQDYVNIMNPSNLLTTVEAPFFVREHLTWLKNRQSSVQLIVESLDRPISAKIIDVSDTTIVAVCSELPTQLGHVKAAYSMIGMLANGSSFLACGEVDLDPERGHQFRLTLPRWIDVSQSRNSLRCRAPAGHFIHLSSADPHLHDIVCKVRDISLGGIAFEFESKSPCGNPDFNRNSITDYAIFKARSSEIQLGKLRVAHVTKEGKNFIIGCTFLSSAPRQFDFIVMDVQRAKRMLS
jgi:hypothetical protein